jgi:biopolymer transport protein ExbD
MTADSRSDDDVIAGINVTPLVDITLVLLVIFMVTARIITSPAVPMNPPRSTTSTEVTSPLSIELLAGGEVRMGGRSLTSDDEVVRLAREGHQKDPELRALIRADTAVPHGRVIRAIDLLKQGGVERIAFAVAPGEAPPGTLIARPAP